MLTIRVKDGTPTGSTSLCYSCTWGHVMRGFRESQEIVYCTRFYPDVRVPFPVRECSNYCNKNHPSKDDMEKTAWILLTKRIERNVGFVKIGDYRRICGEDAEITP